MGKAEYGEFVAKKKTTKTVSVNVECGSDISCEVRDILSLHSSCVQTGAECKENEIFFSGRVIFNAVYSLEGEIKRKELGVDFSDTVKAECNSSDKVKVTFSVDSVSCEKQDRIKITAQITATTVVEKNDTKGVLVGGEDYLINKKSVTVNEEKVVQPKTFTLDDEFETTQIKNVLSSWATARITACQCGISSVICDGEIILTLALLPIDEKSDIVKECRVIPFRLELEADGTSVDDVGCAEVSVTKTALKVFVDEDKGKSTITSQLSLSLSANAYSRKEFVYADDLFSLKNELGIAKEKIEYEKVIKGDVLCEKVRGKAFCDVPENARLITCIDDRVYNLTRGKEKNQVTLDGILSGYCLFSVDGQVISKLAEMPFSVSLNCEDEFEVTSYLTKGINARLRNGEVEFEIEVAISYKTFTTESFCAVTAAEEKEELPKNEYAFSVYIPEKNDGLWEICKALKVSPETVTEQNDLTFPLKENQKIIVYRRI